MSWVRGIMRRVFETFHASDDVRELDAEIETHIALEVDRLVAEGRSEAEARAEALRRFGSVSSVKETAREEAGFRFLEQTVRDVRYGLRGLRRAPTFAAAAILTLGLGIGATTAIYSVVDAVLLEPLPYERSDELVRIYQQNSPTNRWALSVVDYEAIRDRQTAFSVFAAARPALAAFTGRGNPERIPAVWVSADWFRLFGIQPAIGRAFTSGEDFGIGPATVVVSASFADRVLGTDPVGQSVVLDGQPHVVIGVLPENRETIAAYRADVWPLLRTPTPGRRGPFFLRGFARLDDGRTFGDGWRDLERVSEQIFPLWADGFPDPNARLTPYPLRDTILGNVGGGLWLLLGAVVGLLLICVANVANLQLVRASSREREMALRTSLGAGRGRLARQLLAESTLLAGLGGLLGVGLALVGLRTIVAASPGLPRVAEVSIDAGVLAFAALVTAVTGLLFGLAPIMHATSRQLAQRLRGDGRGGSDSRAWERARSLLVTTEFAIALPILAGAGLLLTSLQRLSAVDPGYESEGLISASIALPTATYPSGAEVQAYWTETLRRIEELPTVESAGVSTGLPPNAAGMTNNFDLLDRPVGAGESEHVTVWTWTSPGFLEALGVSVLEGRTILESDRYDENAIVVVSRSWADRFFPDGDAIGAQLYGGGDYTTPITIAGIVDDVKVNGLGSDDHAAVYEPYAAAGFRNASLLVRYRGPVTGLVANIEAAVRALDPELPLSNIQTMDDRLAASTATPRYWTTLLGLFATLGLVLAGIGVYGVLNYHVARQSKMIGIRVALGARPREVCRLVVRRGMSRALLGVGVGLVGALVLTRWLESLLFGVSPTDVATLVTAAAVLLLVAFLACYLPARRATRIDPLEALRMD